MALTRGKTSNPICHAGLATELPRNVLPKEIDIYNYLKFLQGQGQSLINIANSIAEEVVEIWTEKGNLPTITEQAVAKKVKEIHKRGKNFMKKPVQRRISTIHEPLEGVKSPNSRGRPRKTDNFEGLFDICTCHCASRNSCTCPSDKKVHEREWEFLADQRTNRNMVISSSVDADVTRRWARRDATKMRMLNHEIDQDVDVSIMEESDQNSTPSLDNLEADKDTTPPKEEIETNQNRFIMDKFLDELDRYNISDMCGAALITAIFEDIKWITSDNTKLVFDRFKIRRQRKKRREERVKENKSTAQGKIRCIGVDGKRDKHTKTLVEKEINGLMNKVREQKTEEHMVFTDPYNYITHSVIEDGQGTGINLGKHLVDTIREFNSQDVIECVLSDGTAVNTGCYNGMIACAERELGKELQWSICQLHGNESPMRHIFNHLDGGRGTSGPNTFNGPMGRSLTQGDVHSKEAVAFEPIKAPSLPVLPERIVKDLSRDQKLLYEYSIAVDTGDLPSNVATQKPGPINHARWLTLCLSALIDYTRDAKPSLNKVKFIDYVQKVYVPAWFTFKMSCKLKDGAKNVFTMLQLLKTQPLDIQNIAKKYVQINAFFAHSSNLLVAMLAEEDDESIRKQAVDGIIEIRKNKEHSCVERTDSGLRLFKVPKLNWGAENYTQIIDWDLKDFCEPPITMKFSDDEIRRFYSVPMVIQNYPSQSQSVERAVKMVSDACKSAYGYEERHQLVLSTQAARKERQSYRTKEKFKRLERGMQKLKEPNM